MDEFGIFMKVVEMEQSQKLARSIGGKNCWGTKRDERNTTELRKMGWRVLQVWECEIEKSLRKP